MNERQKLRYRAKDQAGFVWYKWFWTELSAQRWFESHGKYECIVEFALA